MNNTLEGMDMAIPMKSTSCSRECPLFLVKASCQALLAAEVQRLRDEREANPGVWDGAGSWAGKAIVRWIGRTVHGTEISRESTLYMRALPKTLAQEIAEKWAKQVPPNDIADGGERTKVYLAILAEFEERTKKEGGK
jgi:hypothetical protein